MHKDTQTHTYIYELEKIQKSFTSKINVMEELDYHERLKKLILYSPERRREQYMIIYGWQQLEEIRENVLRLTATKTKRSKENIPKKYQTWQMRNVCQG